MKYIQAINLLIPNQVATMSIRIPINLPRTLTGQYKIRITFEPDTTTARKNTVYLTGFNRALSRETICNVIDRALSTYGHIDDIRIPVNLDTNTPKGYAFVTFKSDSAASKFMEYTSQCQYMSELWQLTDNTDLYLKWSYAKVN